MININIQKAREWAKKYQRHHVIGSESELAAVRVIQSLPNTVVDGDKLRDVINKILANTIHGTVGHQVAKDYAALIGELIPAPAPRTLADMNLEELKTHVGGEVMVDGWANPTMLVSVIEDEGAVLARRLNKPWPFVEIRPLSDLTPVAAPEQEAESTPETAQTRPEDVPPGEWWSVRYYDREWAGVRSDHPLEPWSIISMDGLDYRDVDDSEITLMFRLVPEIP